MLKDVTDALSLYVMETVGSVSPTRGVLCSPQWTFCSNPIVADYPTMREQPTKIVLCCGSAGFILCVARRA